MARASEGRDDLLVSNEDVKKTFQAAAFESYIGSLANCPLLLHVVHWSGALLPVCVCICAVCVTVTT